MTKGVHPWEKAVERVKKKGLQITYNNVRAELEKLGGHGYFFRENEEQHLMLESNPRLLFVHKDALSMLSEKVRQPKKWVKPIVFVPDADDKLKAAILAYNVAKDLFGRRLKAFAVVGGALTANITGIPVKVAKIAEMGSRGEVRTRFRRAVGRVDDLDIVVVVNRAGENDQRAFMETLRKAYEQSGLGHIIVDDSRPFVISADNYDALAHFFHEQKPVAFFVGRKFVEKLRSNPRFRTLAEKEAEIYNVKSRMYDKKMREDLESTFRRALQEANKIDPDKRRKFAEKFETLYHLASSKPIRALVDNLMLKYGENAHSEHLRYALARMLWRYIQMASEGYRISGEWIFKLWRAKKSRHRG